MIVKIQMSRAENVARFGTGPVSLDIEDYLCGVVPSEIYESAAMDALKAQAIAARTYTLKRALAGTALGDTSSSQVYRFSLSESSPRSKQAILETKGQVLYHDGQLIDCYYSASNNGVTKRSGDVWRTHYPYYVSKVDEWDIQANWGKPSPGGHGIGLSQTGAMWAAKEGIPYQQILAFYYEGTALVPDCGQSGFPLPGDTSEGKCVCNLIIHERIMTRNDSFAYGRKIVPQGIMVHSTAAPGVMAAQWFDRWNRSYKAGETTRQVSMHAFVDNNEVWQYLPWDQRAWHAAGTANDTHIAFEICEPAGHTFASGGTIVNYNAQKNEAYFRGAWGNAVALCAMLCRCYNLPVQNIIGHYEGYKMRIANNHADPGHWFPKHGESMDTFRTAVNNMLGGYNSASGKPELPSVADHTPYTVQPNDTLWGIARNLLGVGTRYTEIMMLNRLETTTIRAGQILLLPM